MAIRFWSPSSETRPARWRTSPAVVRYSVAVALWALALAGRFALGGVLPATGFPFLTFFPAVLVSAYLAGIGPGLVASALSVAAAWYFFIGQARTFDHLSQPDVVALAFFAAVLLVDCVVIHVMNHSLDRVRETERHLRESQDRLRRVLDRLPVSVSILDLDGTRREVNEASFMPSGSTRGALVGQPFWQAPWWARDPERQQQVRSAIEQAAHGQTVRFDTELAAGRGPARVLSLEVAPLREAAGRISALVTCGVDITERAQALADLVHSRADALAAAAAAERERRVLDATFNAVPAGIIVADASGRLVRMNRANERIWGIAPYSTDIEGYGDWKGWWAGDSPRAGQRIESHEWGLARSLRGEECTDIVEIEPFGQPGKRLVTLLSSAPVLDPAGQVVGGVVVQVDITDHIRAEQALREADRQKDTFLATLSHELRNPLAPIRSAAHVLRLTFQADPRTRNAVAVIERQSAQLARLVDDLLDISRLNFDNLTLERAWVDLREVVDAALETSRPALEAAGHTLSVRLPAQPLMVQVDATRIAQCIANLLNNASKFTAPPGRIELEVVAQPGQQVVVRVADSGQGIAAEMLERVFDLFIQDQRSGMGGNTGLGIGLALTRRLVELHGGRVRAHSEGQGRGALFEIVLPMEPPAESTARPMAGSTHATPMSSVPSRVLVVDDNVDAADTLRLLLEMQDLEVATAHDGASALAQALSWRPSVIVLDIGLPDMTGYDVARRLRESPGWEPPPLLIALTGWGQAKDRERAVQAGFDHHLTKPADPQQVTSLVLQHLKPGSGRTPDGAPSLSHG